ncbi:DUF4112 domain-containing protein [uncultured Zhongshania sp.]|jgi:hypothetical protein|uniref:DUF4112 domain-containing protein n=1 Tax=uncultured Zhongshania sp. TaxID=1642288 RepID=UPI001B7AAFBE|nr:DUF4112 domain-containing protein [uncultured Zhongshania sp.]MBQ0760486.1 DUF4112 domain-containing protein [Zhongshania sp.]
MISPEAEQRLQRSRKLAILLDGAWGIPNTPWRFGIDSLLGLLPVAGDFASALLGLIIVWQAHRLKAPRFLKLRMLGNIGLDFLIGSIPIIGDIADVAFRKNIRNADLLEAWLKK